MSLVLLLVLPSLASAQSADLDKRTQNFYFNTDATFIVHKSNTLKGTDFGSRYDFSTGTWTGKNKTLGMALRIDSEETAIPTIDSKIGSAWTDFQMLYRFYWFYPMVSMGSCSVKALQASAAIVDSVCTTVGGGLGIHIAAGAVTTLIMDTEFINASRTRDALSQTTSLGARTDVNTGVEIAPGIDWFQIRTGYRYREYELILNDKKGIEIESGPYLGFELGYSF